MVNHDFFRGRKLLISEIPAGYVPDLASEKVLTCPSMLEKGDTIKCLRCGSVHWKKEVTIQSRVGIFYYCSSCLQLGRIQSNRQLYYQKERRKAVQREIIFKWQGQLTELQEEASSVVKQSMLENRDLLVHAVTGAGKTEMLFAGIKAALKVGKRICLASPRIDVFLELYPRFQAAFPAEAIGLLHGKQENPYEYTSFVICTTHQLLRFYRSFDILIIDELDSFPYVANPMLHYGAKNAAKKSSSRIYLSATPTLKLLTAVKNKTLKKVTVYQRYHGKPLPVPKGKWLEEWEKGSLKTPLNKNCKKIIMKQLESKRRTLIFCPTIKWLKEFEQVLKKEFPEIMIGTAHGKDSKRQEKVKKMRLNHYQLFLSTTILERGVTFKDIDVIVMGSNQPIFTAAVLIQIAGRVGRSADYSRGLVLFVHNGWSKAMRKVISEIKKMNQLGGRLK